ncbi:hypothetical protein [Novosphingobium album (ex Liu et al. 2023)]|uniref:Nucleoside phosphorylase domain-containing protein n=1 Tax=Novosphingobium album (ex Liu et al. 2023) TaxID=3031130 RepID=A0ABT5WXI9_9SPHN|nr:hypothetical protein [Novosphingobium album (ex Liu et al. 2023)]MDE8654620.1 hypothetical protein [Novosphingobium album (ex Liu et al. 2023)]
MSSRIFDIADEALTSIPKEVAAQARDRAKGAARRIRIGIITALPLEANAIAAALGGDAVAMPIVARKTQVSYFIHTFRSSLDGGEIEVVVALANQMGNNAAAVTATSLLMDFEKVDDLLVVGIAGGVPAPTIPHQHARLGDIVVGLSGVIQYDFKKVEVDKSELRKGPPPPSALLTTAINQIRLEEERGHRSWEQFLDPDVARPRLDVLYDPLDHSTPAKRLRHPRQNSRRKGLPMVHYGLIGSANVLLKNPMQRDILAKEHKLIAVEMEGSGIADAAWNFARGYVIVRAVCDYCDMHKNDRWQRYAANAAAAYARAIVERALAREPILLPARSEKRIAKS